MRKDISRGMAAWYLIIKHFFLCWGSVTCQEPVFQKCVILCSRWYNLAPDPEICVVTLPLEFGVNCAPHFFLPLTCPIQWGVPVYVA